MRSCVAGKQEAWRLEAIRQDNLQESFRVSFVSLKESELFDFQTQPAKFNKRPDSCAC